MADDIKSSTGPPAGAVDGTPAALTGAEAIAELRTAYRDELLVLAAADLAAVGESELPVLALEEVAARLAALAAAALQAALLRYLAVAHFGRGRGDYVQGESPPHWPQVLAAATAAQQPAIDALWSSRSRRFDNAGEGERLAAALQPLLAAGMRSTLEQLYPSAAPDLP